MYISWPYLFYCNKLMLLLKIICPIIVTEKLPFHLIIHHLNLFSQVEKY